MASSATPTPRLAGPERRELVLRAGGAEFGRRGYDAARIEDIARAAGVTKPIVYRHFDSKKGLYLALLRKHETDLPTFVADAGATTPGAILEVWLDYVRQNSHAWLMLFRDHSGDEEIQTVRAEVSVTARQVMSAFVASRRPDLAPEQIEPMAELLSSGLAGLALWWIDRPDTPKDVVLAAATAMTEPALEQKKPTAPQRTPPAEGGEILLLPTRYEVGSLTPDPVSPAGRGEDVRRIPHPCGIRQRQSATRAWPLPDPGPCRSATRPRTGSS